jgi:hypothetical protein
MTITKLYNGGELREVLGNKWWYLNGVLHREDGPAVEGYGGHKEYYINGKLHREDGPAVEYYSGRKYWYINNRSVPCTTQKQFKRLMRLKAFW